MGEITEQRRDGFVEREVAISAGLAVLIAAVYGRVAGYEFITYDDPAYVTDNAIVKAGLTWEGLKWAFGNLHGEYTYWHPLSWLSHMLDVELFGLNAGAHHLVNAVFHVANSILLFLLFRQMTGAVWRSAVVAALFAVHPLQVDTVAWVTERKNVLSTLFWILTTMAYVRYARGTVTKCASSPLPSPPSERGEGVITAQRDASPYLFSYVLVIVLFAVGLMCKPALVTLPFVLLLLDYWPLGRLPSGLAGPLALLTTPTFRRLILEKAPLFVLTAVSCWITAAAHKALGSTEAAGLTLGMRIENAIVSYGRYLGKIVWPSDLAIIYPYPEAWPKTTVFITLAVLLLITMVVVRDFRLRPYLPVGWFWFLGVLVPAIGIVQAGPQAMADRFAYVPVIGVFVMLVWTVADELSSEVRRAWVPGLAASLAVASCVVITWVQLSHWKNSETVFKQALKVTPGNYVAHVNLAVYHLGRGETNAVVTHATEALRANRESFEPYLYLGKVSELGGDIPGAISNYHRALSIEPKWEPARKALAAARGGNSSARTEPE